MRQELRSEIASVLTAHRFNLGPLAGLINGLEVARVWDSFLRGSVSWTRPWSLYVLQRWCELQNVTA